MSWRYPSSFRNATRWRCSASVRGRLRRSAGFVGDLPVPFAPDRGRAPADKNDSRSRIRQRFEKLFLRIGSDDVTPGSDRWLSQFRVQQQADHGHQILGALAAEEARVHEFALQLVRRMLPMRAASSRWVVVLPELLKGVETL